MTVKLSVTEGDSLRSESDINSRTVSGASSSMANHIRSPLTVSIPEAVTAEGVTLYHIHVRVGEVSYHVERRFSQFQAMHSLLVEGGVDRELLPPKKLLGSKEPAFIMKRRRELEVYLQAVCHFLERNLSPHLATFLDLGQYDIHLVVSSLAEQCGQEEPPAPRQWTPLHLHSISERLQTPCPPLDVEDRSADFTNLADSCCRLEELAVAGSTERLGTSNLIHNELCFDFLAFKSLSSLSLEHLDISPLKISSLGLLRSSLVSLTVRQCGLSSLSQILLCDTLHSLQDLSHLMETRERQVSWHQLKKLDCSHNNISLIDCSVRLAKGLTSLTLSHNSITKVDQVTGLPHLSSLLLSHNQLKDLADLHTKLGQVTLLDIQHNSVRHLAGLERCFSLSELYAGSNKLRTLADVSPVTSLPCLERIQFSPNRVTNEVDYRLKVLEGFGGRCGDVQLDGVATSRAEMDKVSVLMALAVARDGKQPTALFGNLPGSNHLGV